MMTVYIQRKKCVKKWNEKVPRMCQASYSRNSNADDLLLYKSVEDYQQLPIEVLRGDVTGCVMTVLQP